MSIIGKIFSAGAGELVKNVGGVLDNLTTTKEEKLAAEAKIKDLIMGYEAEMQKQVIKEEAKKLEGMAAWKARVLGIGIEDVL